MRPRYRRLRYWLPAVGCCGCLLVSTWVGPLVAWLLIIAAFVLLLDVSTAGFEQAGGTGTLWDHKQ